MKKYKKREILLHNGSKLCKINTFILRNYSKNFNQLKRIYEIDRWSLKSLF